MDLTNDDVLKILKIIDESDYDDVRLEIGDLQLHVQKKSGAASELLLASQENNESPRTAALSAQPAAAPAAKAPATVVPTAAKTLVEETIPEGMTAVRSPMLGTFYRAPAPGEKPFVEVGDTVVPDDTVCLVEVMKLFNSIKAGVAGTVMKIHVENASMVEYGQLLILIKHDPAKA